MGRMLQGAYGARVLVEKTCASFAAMRSTEKNGATAGQIGRYVPTAQGRHGTGQSWHRADMAQGRSAGTRPYGGALTPIVYGANVCALWRITQAGACVGISR